ncbi:MAG: BLUF domain-containing protein [Acidobacteriota bacterium]|nr:BLUF domain-containing protein [Acidobacteriota bacterium]
MEQTLYSIVYCSRNRIPGEASEVTRQLHDILASARRNNGAAGVSGALLYNAGSFAQILEGPLRAIERVFEVIQRDPRHTDVTVIQSGRVVERQFPDWSMAFAGNSSMEGTPVATAAFDAVFSRAAGGGEQMLSLMSDLIVSDEEWVLLDVA